MNSIVVLVLQEPFLWGGGLPHESPEGRDVRALPRNFGKTNFWPGSSRKFTGTPWPPAQGVFKKLVQEMVVLNPWPLKLRRDQHVTKKTPRMVVGTWAHFHALHPKPELLRQSHLLFAQIRLGDAMPRVALSCHAEHNFLNSESSSENPPSCV